MKNLQIYNSSRVGPYVRPYVLQSFLLVNKGKQCPVGLSYKGHKLEQENYRQVETSISLNQWGGVTCI